MPRLPETIRRQRQVQDCLAEWAEFEAGFQRSRKGNLWRVYDGLTVTVFQRVDGEFGWCIAADEDDTQFSSRGYETEEEALEVLGAELFC